MTKNKIEGSIRQENKNIEKVKKIKRLRKNGKAQRGRNIPNKTKINTKQRRRKKQQKHKPRSHINSQRQSCSGNNPVSSTCMTNAASVLIFEKNQVTNYLKQAKQLIRHKNMTENKQMKKGEFEETASKMLEAIGGNLSNPICGQKSKGLERALDHHLSNYTQLLNCSKAILEACGVPDNLHNEESAKELKDCDKKMVEFKDFTQTCFTDKIKND